MRCSCAALAALLEALEGEPRDESLRAFRETTVNSLAALAQQTRRTLDLELARCARQVGTTPAEIRDLCAMFPPLDDCGRHTTP